MALTRIENNQISNAVSGNSEVGINGNLKLQEYTVTGSRLANDLSYGSNFTATGNITGGNVFTGGEVSATGNIITAGYFLGNIACAQGYNSNTIFNGTSNVLIATANGNITMSVGGTPNVVIVTSDTLQTNNFSTAGNAIIGGDLVVNGNLTYVNVTDLNVEDPIIGLGRGPNNSPLTTDDGKDRGEQLWYYAGSEKSAFTGYDNSAGKILLATDVTITNEIVSVNNYGNLVIGNLEGASSSVTGTATAGNVLTGGIVSAAGTGTFGNVATGGTISATGTATAGNVLTGGVVSATGTGTFGNVATGGTISATGTATAGNVLTGGIVSATGTGTFGNVDTGGTVSATGNATFGNVGTNQLSLSGNVISALNVTGNITGSNLITSGNVFAPAIIANSSTYDTRISLNSAAGIIEVSPGGNGTQFTPSGQINLNGVSTIAGGTFSGSGFTAGPSQTDLFQNRGGNVTVQLGTGGTIANTWTFAQSGAFLAPGAISATGNVTGANLFFGSGVVSGTGNIYADNIFANITGNIDAAGSNTEIQFNDGGILGASANFTFASNTNTLTVSNGNIVGGNLLTGGTISATSTIQGGNVLTAGDVSAGGSLTGGNIFTGGIVSAVSTITGGNIATAGDVTATGTVTGGNIATAGSVSATGTVIAGNVTTAGSVSATGTVTAGNVNTAGNVSATGTGTFGNITTGGTVSAQGNIQGGNLLTGGLISVTGNVTADYFFGNGSQLTGIDTNLIKNGSSNVRILTANGNISMDVNATSNVVVVTDAGINLTGLLSASGNVTGQNLFTAGNVSATGDVYANNTRTSNVISTGALNITSGSNGNINIQPNGTGNIILANTYINSVAYPVQDQDAASKVYVDNLVSTAISYHEAVLVATTTTLATTTGGTITYAQPNGAGNGQGATLTTTGSFNLIDSGNVQTAGTRILVKNEANATHNGVYVWSNATVITRSTSEDTAGTGNAFALGLNDYFFVSSGNVNLGSAWIVDAPTSAIVFGTSNIEFAQFSQSQVYSANTSAGINLIGQTFNAKIDNNTTAFDGGGNIIVKAGANLTTPNIGAATGTSLSLTGNVVSGNVFTGGEISAVGTAHAGNLHTSGIVTATGNITGANMFTGGAISATGNINGGNIISGNAVVGNIDVSGNIVVNSLTANTTISASGTVTGGNLATAGSITATGTITGGNVLTGGVVSASGNVTGGNVLFDSGIVSGTGSIFGGNVFTGGVVSATANVTGGNLLTAGQMSATGTVHGGNILTAGDASAGGSLTGGNIFTGGTVSATSTITGGNIATAGTVTATGTVTGGNIATAGTVSATGNITGGNVLFGAGIVSGTGNIYADNIFANITGNIDAAGSNTEIQFNDNGLLGASSAFTFNTASNTLSLGGAITATGNITGSYFFGNGSQLTGIDTTLISNGNSNVQVYANSNVAVTVAGTANVAVFTTTGISVTGNVQASNFVSAANAVFGTSLTPTTGATVAINSTDSLLIPVGNTIQRPTGATGMLRFNTTTDKLEIYDSNSWEEVGATVFTVIGDQQFAGDGSTLTFALSDTQTTNSCIVSINGVVQIPSTSYSVTGTNLTFTEAPQPGDDIDVRKLTTTTTVIAIQNSPANASITVNDTSNVITVTGQLQGAGNALTIIGDLTITGNATISGNVATNQINNGTSAVQIPSLNGNVNIDVGAVDNMTVFTSTGAFITGNLSVTGNVTAQDVNSLSDVTLKTNIQPISGIESVLFGLNGYEYDWKNGSGHSYGFLAQEVEKVLPNAVKTGADGLKAINYMMIIPFLVETIKQMGSEIKDLKQTVSGRGNKK